MTLADDLNFYSSVNIQMKKIIFNIVFVFLIFSQSVFSQLVLPENGPVFSDTTVPRIDIMFSADSLESLMDPVNAESDHHYMADFIFDNGEILDTLKDVGIRLRGNTSRNSEKKSFKISFNTYKPGRKFRGVEKMNLNGEHNDPSIIRSKVCADMLNNFNIPAPRANHVNLYMNGDFYGVYINVEHIDEEFIQSRFGNQNGNLYKCLWPADLNYISSNPNDYKFTSGNRRAYDLKTNVGENDYSDLAEFIDILNNTSIDDLPCELDRVLNVDNMIRAIAFDILSGNWDGPLYNKNNFYLYKNPQSGKFEYIPYDLDNTLGIDWLNRDWGTRNIYDWGKHGEKRPLFYNLLAPPAHRDRLSYYLDKFIETYFNEIDLFPLIDEKRSMISADVEQDPFSPMDYGFSYQDFLDSYTKALDASHVAYGLKPFITTRKNTALGQLEMVDIDPVIRNVYLHRQNNELWVYGALEDDGNIQNVQCCYTQNEGAEVCFDLLDNGIFPDNTPGDGSYAGIFPINTTEGSLEYYLTAKDDLNNSGRYPVCGFDTYGFGDSDNLLVINEILTDNSSINSDESGEFDDWIELYNSGTNSIFLGNKYLSDDRFNGGKWKLPFISIEPGDFLLVWADDQQEQGDLHASFKLSKSGEFIGVFEKQGDEFLFLNGFDFGAQEKDVSFGRFPDGSDLLSAMYPTPGSSNQVLSNKETIGLKIKITPNPSRGQFQILFDRDSHELYSIKLFNDSGILLNNLTNLKTTEQVLKFQSLTPGVYLLQFIIDNRVYNEKMVIY